ncbi:hypothetical protein ACWD6P_20760 [Streptomyces sp. NPDC002446]
MDFADFVDFLGSGGAYASATKTLQEHDPAIRCCLAELVGAASLAGRNVAAELKLLAGEVRGKCLAVVMNDSGLKRLSTTDLREDG